VLARESGNAGGSLRTGRLDAVLRGDFDRA
jgi:hypothetical protein